MISYSRNLNVVLMVLVIVKSLRGAGYAKY